MTKNNIINKLFYFSFFSSLLLFSINVVQATSNKNSNTHTAIKLACSSTTYPELCFSSITATTEKVSTKKEIIELSLNITIKAVQNNTAIINNIQKNRTNLTKRAKIALQDCLEITNHTLSSLRRCVTYLNNDTNRHVDDLKTLISAAITDQDTCMDGFSHDARDRNVRDHGGIMDGHMHVERMSSNTLAMILNMTSSTKGSVNTKSKKTSGHGMTNGRVIGTRGPVNTKSKETSGHRIDTRGSVRTKSKETSGHINGIKGSLRTKSKETSGHIIGIRGSTRTKSKETSGHKIGVRGSVRTKLKENGGHGIRWPKWMSAGDRRLLQSSTVEADVVVAADGSGDYTRVSEAVAAAPEESSTRYVISIKAGEYNEIVEVPSEKVNLMFVGEGASTTIITGSKNVADGSTTYRSATVAIVGDGFLARDITFQNTAGPTKNQAVAMRVEADLSAFYLCNFLGYQDTLYVRINRQFFVDCLVEGTVDFIFGNSAVVFQDCHLRARLPRSGQKNTFTAQGRTDPNQNTGIVIQNSTIAANEELEAANGSVESYLGRPWKEYSRTVIMESYISDIINSAGWLAWSGTFALDTLFYAEYDNNGPGADTSQRVDWAGFTVITNATEALSFTPGSFISGSSWLPSTGFPYDLGL